MSESGHKELTGWHVLWILIAFFGVMVIVNVIFTVLAVRSFTGEDVPKSYRQGIEYNQTIQARRAQALLGWQIKANSYALENGSTSIVVDLRDDSQRRIPDLKLFGILRHPTDKEYDQAAEFTQNPDGLYRTSLPLAPGDWTLIVSVKSKGEDVYRFTHALWVS